MSDEITETNPNHVSIDVPAVPLGSQQVKVKVSREQKLLLYKASINCNWEETEKIFTRNPGVPYDQELNEKKETALHVVAAAKADSEKMSNFVTQLLEKMTDDSKKAKTKDGHTALYLAVVAGNIEFVKIMVPKDSKHKGFNLGKTLLKTPGGGKFKHMPLSAAALFGNYDVVEHIFHNFPIDFNDDGWVCNNNHNKLIRFCIENDMFDIALEIVNLYIKSGNGSKTADSQLLQSETPNKKLQPPPAGGPNENLIISPEHPYNGGMILRALAQKPKAFNKAECTFIETCMESLTSLLKWLLCMDTRKSYMNKNSQAMQLLRVVWENILKGPTEDIEKALVGPLGSNRDYNTVSGWDVQAIQLQELICAHDRELAGNQCLWVKKDKEIDLLSQATELSGGLDDMFCKTQKIIEGSPIKQDHKPVSSKERESLELQTLIFKHIAKTKNMTKKSYKVELLINHMREMREEKKRIIKKYARHTPSAHIIAAEMGNTNFLIELINQYPDLIWKLDGNNQSIFHIAIRHRHERSYTLLYDLGTQKDLMTIYKDPDGNSMLHLVGKLPREHRLEEVSGAALQMQRELLWFKEVEKMIPRSYSEDENSDGLTPHELFRKEHKDLCKQGEEWIKGTASQCMVVAALVATMVFTAAFTVPGGYDQRDEDNKGYHYGKPVFHSKSTFMVFVMADAVSLALSCVSILSFLSVLTSRFREDDFLQSLFKRLRWGLVTLLFSIATMLLAFGISFFVLYSKGSLWVPIVICTFAVIVIVLYIFLYGRLFRDVFTPWIWNEPLFKPKKRVLSYEDS